MHVLITTDAVGGVWTYTRELVSGLVARGIRVTLVSFGVLPSREQTEWLQALPEVDYRPNSLRLEWMEAAGEDVQRSLQYLEQTIREVKPDLLHSNQFCFGSVKADVPRIVVAHSDVVSWWQAVHGSDPPAEKWAWYRHVVSVGLRDADTVIAPSQWMMDSLRANYRMPIESRVIYNGRSPELFTEGKKERFVLSAGRLWDKAKNLGILLNAGLNLPVVIAGATEEPGKDEIRRPEASDVRLRGELSEEQLRDLYARAAIYVATSRYEPFGLAPLEAALSGCALVVNDIPVFRELWADSAMYFDENDAGSMREAISELASDENLRLDFARKARTRALETLQAECMVEHYAALYEQVCARERVA